MQELEGFLVLDKPVGLTSHDLVGITRAVTRIAKVGHTGTLDPFATGVLPLALGRATRYIQYLDEREKVYCATLRLGQLTDTGDLTGTVIQEKDVPRLSRTQVEAVLSGFLGPQMQTPPRYSAVKIDGRALYDYARAGKDVTAEARPITVYGLHLDEIPEDTQANPTLTLTMRVSRGTYARVLGEEIAAALGTVAHLSALRRLQSGAFTLENTLTLSVLAETVADDTDWMRVFRGPKGPDRQQARIQWHPPEQVCANLRPYLWNPTRALAHLPVRILTQPELQWFQKGGAVPKDIETRPCLVMDEAGNVLTVAG